MAAAFHADQRIHHPLNAPLDDIFPDLAKLKPRWPTPAAKLSNYVHAVQKYDYQRDKHIAKRGDDDLIILNIYCTHTMPVNMGIGSDPCTPFYLIFALKNTNDVPLVAVQKKGLFSKHSEPPGQHPLRVQYAVQRHGIDIDNSRPATPGLPQALAMTTVPLPGRDKVVSSLILRWSEVFVETRLSKAFEMRKTATMRASLDLKKKKIVLNCLAPEKLLPANTVWGLTNAKSVVVTEKERRDAEVRVGRIYRDPSVTPIRHHTGKFFSTLEELLSSDGIDLFYSPPGTYGDEGFYWFTFHGDSWRLVVNELPADWSKDGLQNKPPLVPKKSSLEKLNDVKAGMKKAFRGEKAVKPEWEPPDHSYVIELFGMAHTEPLIHFDLFSGQLWALKTVPITMLDVAVTLLGAIFNLEEDIRRAVNFKVAESIKSGTWSKEMKEMKKGPPILDDKGCI